MYENKSRKSETIAGIILIIIVFIIFPITCSDKFKSNPKYFDQMDGTEDPYWSP